MFLLLLLQHFVHSVLETAVQSLNALLFRVKTTGLVKAILHVLVHVHLAILVPSVKLKLYQAGKGIQT
jgi:hypothetical protein